LLDSVEAVLGFAKTLTIKGKQPVVTLVEEVYHTGVKLTKQAMADVEAQIDRLPDLRKWFVSIIVNSEE
jgi:Rhodopirellula transposase DDE domain